MTESSLPVAVIRSEWLKFRTIRSSIYGVLLTLFLTIGLGALIAIAIRSHFHSMNVLERASFDPVTTSLGGTMFAQFAAGVIGVVFISNEYTTHSMTTTLTAVPQRGLVVMAKLVVVVSSLLVVGEIASFVTFQVGQSIFAGVVPTASLTNTLVLRSVVLAGVYLALMSALGLGLGLIFRHSASSISVFTSLLLIVPIITIFLPASWQNSIDKYEPSVLGRAMMSPVASSGDFAAIAAFFVLLVYVIVVLSIGSLFLLRRDA